jgi:hypothetical protein
LSILCESIRRDVLGDEAIRQSAFNLKETPDDEDEIVVEEPAQLRNGMVAVA